MFLTSLFFVTPEKVGKGQQAIQKEEIEMTN